MREVEKFGRQLRLHAAAFLTRLQQYNQAEIFAVIAGIAGLGFVFVTPPMQAPDEVEHFYRAYQISELHILPEKVTVHRRGVTSEGYGGTLPVSVVEAARTLKGKTAGSAFNFDYSALGAASKPLSPNNRVPVRFDNTTIYSPIPYIPQAIGVGVGRVFNANPVVLSYLGRIANLVVWIAFIYVAIRLTPIGKWVFTSIALNPLALFLASNLSPDALATGLSAVFVAFILWTRQQTKPASLRIMSIFAAMVLGVCLLKNAYIPLVLTALLIPSKFVKLPYKLAIVSVGIVVGLAWNATILSAANEIPEYFEMPGHINARDQVSYIVHHPVRSIGIIAWNIVGSPSSALSPRFNSLIGWGDIPLPFWASLASFAAIGLALLRNEATEKVKRAVLSVRVRLYATAVLAVSLLAIMVSLYLGWSEVGDKLISGVQGRYLIPLTFLLVPIFAESTLRIEAKPRTFARMMIVIYSVVLAAAVGIAFLRYTHGIWW